MKIPQQAYKLLLPVSIIIIITVMAVAAGVSFYKICNISEQMIATNNQNIIKSELIREMTESSLNRSILLLKMVQTKDDFKREEIYTQVNKLATKFTVAREALTQQKLSAVEQSILIEHGIIARRNVPLEHSIYDDLLTGNTQEAENSFYRETIENRYNNIRHLERLLDTQYNQAQESFKQFEINNKKTIRSIMFSVIITFIVCIFMACLIVRFQIKSNSKLTKIANSDALTNLPNRAKLIRSIEYALEHSPESLFAIVFLDIDYFKSINDNYGHDVGDDILIQFSKKIQSTIAKEDILSRFGGDEFVLMLNSLQSRKAVIRQIAFISELLDTSFLINEKEIFTTSSIGATIYNPKREAIGAKRLLSQADNAMYLSKESGRNQYHLFSKETHERMQREHSLSHELHSIFKNENNENQLYIKYQPLYDLRQGIVIGFEALIRWKKLNGEFISPQEFIPIAEKTNLIEKINLFVIKEVCKQKVIWNDTDSLSNIRINFNLSGNKNSFKFLLKTFKEQLVLNQLHVKNFGIELTESTILDIDKETTAEIAELKDQGLKISIDDFGTGYSSLSYLKKLPLTTIKIDKSFIAGIPENQDDNELVKTIITLGNSFKLDIIAEGVEQQQQLEYLQKNSCKLAQGYYLNRPLDVNDIDNCMHSQYAIQTASL